MQIRVRAVIIKDGKVLLIKRTIKNSIYWVVPGGGVEDNETKEDALTRECEEELGIKIKVGALILEMASRKPETRGQKEYFYLCNIVDGILGSGQGPEFQKNSSYTGNFNIEWKDLKDLPEINLKPEKIKKLIYEKHCCML